MNASEQDEIPSLHEPEEETTDVKDRNAPLVEEVTPNGTTTHYKLNEVIRHVERTDEIIDTVEAKVDALKVEIDSLQSNLRILTILFGTVSIIQFITSLVIIATR